MPQSGPVAPDPRRVTSADRARVCRFVEAVLEGAWSESLVRGALERPGAVGWWVGGDAEPAGALLAESSVGELHILTVGVAAAERRRGLGRLLLGSAVDHARRTRLERIHLEVRESNAGARTLYEKGGFVVVGRRPRYYRDAEDAVLMTLELTAPEGPESSS